MGGGWGWQTGRGDEIKKAKEEKPGADSDAGCCVS